MSIISGRFLPPQAQEGADTITTRPSTTANFYINSLDKPAGQGSGDFQITKKQNLFNGFFSRIGVNEIVLDWGLPNISSYWGNSSFSVTLSGAITGRKDFVVSDGFYTAEQILDELVVLLNGSTGYNTPGLFVITPLASTVALQIDQGVSVSSFVIESSTFTAGGVTYTPGVLARLLFASVSIDAATNVLQPVQSPRILGTTYIDIVSSQLTYNQDLKDNTTADINRDVLYRWYFAFDNGPIPTDTYGIPILQGYDPFLVRRTPPVVKQILWDPTAPIGNVSFQVYDDKGRIINTANFPSGANFQFQLSTLLSEC
jgi:hypothetical protein